MSQVSDKAASGTLDDLELYIGIYRQMLLIRRFEERSAEMYALGKIGGFCHLYIGEEAVAVGAIDAGCRFFAGYPITPASEIADAAAGTGVGA